MLTRLELKELASHTLDGAHFVTLYLNLDPAQVKRDDLSLHFKNLVRAVPPTEKNQAAKDLEKIERYLGDHPEGLKRGLALISASERNFWWVFHSAVPFRDELVIKGDPYLEPLVAQLDQYQRYLVAVVGGEEARLLIASMGTVFEVTDFFRPPSEHNLSRDGAREGGWGGMAEERAQRRKEHTQRILYKDVASAMDGLMKREEIKRILLGGADQARGHFKSMIPESLAHKIVGEFHVDRNAGVKEMLEKVNPAMKEVEHHFEKKALQELFDKSGSEGGSVFGLDAVLSALHQGNVRKMYLIADHVEKGMACHTCKALTPIVEGPCPYCGGELTSVSHMFDLAMQKSLDQNARVDIIQHAPELSKAGGIGALLRY